MNITVSTNELYVKGGKSGVEIVTFTSTEPIQVTYEQITNGLNGYTRVSIVDNFTTNVTWKIEYSGLNVHNEIYKGEIHARLTGSDEDLVVPVTIDCSVPSTNHIETTCKTLYVKGEKNGTETVVFTCAEPIEVTYEQFTNNLNGNVRVWIENNFTNEVTWNVEYSDLYLCGETYSGLIHARLSGDVDSLDVPVVINCSDTLIYSDVPNDTVIEVEEGIHITYSSLPEVNEVYILLEDGTEKNITQYLIDQSINLTYEDLLSEFGDVGYSYLVASNSLTQISHKLHKTMWGIYIFEPEDPNINYTYNNSRQDMYLGFPIISYFEDKEKPGSRRFIRINKQNVSSPKGVILDSISGNGISKNTIYAYVDGFNPSYDSEPKIYDTIVTQPESGKKLNWIVSIRPTPYRLEVISDNHIVTNGDSQIIPIIVESANIYRDRLEFRAPESIELDGLQLEPNYPVYDSPGRCVYNVKIPILTDSDNREFNIVFKSGKTWERIVKIIQSGAVKPDPINSLIYYNTMSDLPEIRLWNIDSYSEDQFQNMMICDTDGPHQYIYEEYTGDGMFPVTEESTHEFKFGFNGQRMDGLFRGVRCLNKVNKLILVGNSLHYLFGGCEELRDISALSEWDTSNVTDMSRMFEYCKSLVSVPLLDTSNVTDMDNMFYGCWKLTEVPLFDTSNVTDMSYMFDDCSSLVSIPQFNTSNVTDMNGMFYNCESLTTIPLLDTSGATRMCNMFHNCHKLKSVPLLDASNAIIVDNTFYKCIRLENLGGFKNLKVDLDLSDSPLLTHQSLMNVINNLAVVSSSPTLSLGTTNLAKLTDDEKMIAINKGWVLS